MKKWCIEVASLTSEKFLKGYFSAGNVHFLSICAVFSRLKKVFFAKKTLQKIQFYRMEAYQLSSATVDQFSKAWSTKKLYLNSVARASKFIKENFDYVIYITILRARSFLAILNGILPLYCILPFYTYSTSFCF